MTRSAAMDLPRLSPTETAIEPVPSALRLTTMVRHVLSRARLAA